LIFLLQGLQAELGAEVADEIALEVSGSGSQVTVVVCGYIWCHLSLQGLEAELGAEVADEIALEVSSPGELFLAHPCSDVVAATAAAAAF
jgi:hypothetical protein